MQKSTIEAIKLLFGIDIILGIVIGTGITTFILWFLMGGSGVLLFPFMAVFLYVLIFIFVLIFGGIKFGYKAVWIVIWSFLFGWYGFKYVYKVTCGPDPEDVKVMKPMAEAISEYIVEHGIPKSLSKIPDLPYRLEGCAWSQKKLERCFFYVDNASYQVDSYFLGELDIEIYNKKTETGLRYELEQNSTNKNWKIVKSDIAFSSKISGICNPMRQ